VRGGVVINLNTFKMFHYVIYAIFYGGSIPSNLFLKKTFQQHCQQQQND